MDQRTPKTRAVKKNQLPRETKAEVCRYNLFLDPADKALPPKKMTGLYGEEQSSYDSGCHLALKLRAILGPLHMGDAIRVKRYIYRNGYVVHEEYVAMFLVDGHG